MVDPSTFTRLVPGFDFLQGLVKNAGAALPTIGQWIAPTLDPKELEKRIEELRTVQFWLEQNARMLAATIQALEVQRMTLSTLKTMNVQMEDLRDALQVRVPVLGEKGEAESPFRRKASPAPAPSSLFPPRPAPAPVEAPPPPRSADPWRTEAKAAEDDAGADADADAEGSDAEAAAAAPMVDPVQWWGALTKQFTELATSAMQDASAEAARLRAAAQASRDEVAKAVAKTAKSAVAAAQPPAAAAPAPARAPAARKRAKAAKPAAKRASGAASARPRDGD